MTIAMVLPRAEAAECQDNGCEPRPANARQFSVLESADHRLMDPAPPSELLLGYADSKPAFADDTTDHAVADRCASVGIRPFKRGPGHRVMLRTGPYPTIHEAPQSDVHFVMQLGCITDAAADDAAGYGVSACDASDAAGYGAPACEASAGGLSAFGASVHGAPAFGAAANRARDPRRLMQPSSIAPEGARRPRLKRTIR